MSGLTPNPPRRRLMAIASAVLALALSATLSFAGPALADDTSTPAPDATSSAPADTSTPPADPTPPAADPTTPPAADPTTPAPTDTPAPATSPDPTTTPAPDPTSTPDPTATATPTPTPSPNPTALPLVKAAADPIVAPAVVSSVKVSLTFDDGNADTVQAGAIMKAAGMNGTYYTNSGTVGLSGYQTRADLATLFAQGNEIAGHTVNHPDLTTLPISEVQRQICVDRDTLLSWGYPIQSFAYPFAATNNAIDAVAQSCGYNSARNLGDIQSRFGCAGCGYAETIPPAKPYELAALDEADDTWTLADLESTVTNAQTHGGGWVILTFHHICDGDCDPLAVTPALFTQFVQWLATQSANGTTVKTVAQVIGGTTKPAVTVPPVSPSAAVTNPSLETLTSGTNLPTCWAEAGFGTNTATYSTVSPGHTGNIAAKLVVTGYSDGDAKVMPSLDLGTCSPSVTAGNAYQLSTWYQSTANTQYDVYLRTTSGAWVYWTSSPFFSSSTGWAHATWNTPAIPAGYDGIDFGLNLVSNATLITDDYAIAPAVTPLVTTATISPAAPDGAQGWYKTQPTVTLSASNTGSPATTVYSLDGGNTWVPYTGAITIPNNKTTFEYKSTTATQTETAQTVQFAVDVDAPTVIAAFNAQRVFSAFGSDPTSGPNAIQYSLDGGVTWINYTAATATDNGSIAVEFRAIDVAGNVSPVVTITEPAITTAVVTPASPDGLAGWYKSHPTVTLSAGTPNAHQVTEYSYTGGAPWTTYTAPIVVPDGVSTVTYNTIGDGPAEANQAVGVFSVDTTVPIVSPVFGATPLTYTVTATDTGGSGVVSVQESINGGAWFEYPGQGTVTTAPGAESLQFKAIDSAGNVSAIVPLTIGNVTVPTTTSAVSPAAPNGANGWYTVDPTVLLDPSTTGGTAVTEYSFNGGGTWVTYTGAITIPAGHSTLSYRTRVTGATEATHTLSFSVDLDAPTVVPVFNSATRTWSATGADATSGLGSIQVRIPGGAWSTYSAPVVIGNGSLSLEFEAVDVAGTVSTVVPLKAGAITTSTVVPAAPDGAAGWYKTAPVVTLSTGASSLGSPSADQVTQYTLNGGTTWLAYAGPITIANGTVTLSYRTSGAGITEATHTLTFKTDTVAPVVTPSFNSTTRTYSAVSTDATSGVTLTQVSVNGGAWATYSGPTAVGTGSTALQFRATDAAGNTSATVTLNTGASVTATIAPVAPNGSNGWYNTAPSVTLVSGALASGETIQYSFNGTTWSTYSTPVALPTGTDKLQFQSTDVSGRASAITSLVIPKGTAMTASAVSLAIDPASVQYLHSGLALVTVTSGGKQAIGTVSVSVDGKPYKSVVLFLGIAAVKLSTNLAVGKHAVTAQYLGSATALPATSSSQTLTVGKAKTTISLSKVVSTTLASKVSGAHSKKPAAHIVQVKVHIVGSKKAAKGKVVITVNGKKIRTVSLASAQSGKLTITLPKLKKHNGKVTVQAKFTGSKSLKSAKSKKLVIKLP